MAGLPLTGCPCTTPDMNDEQLLRYSRHLLLDEIGIEGQQRLLDAHALVIGAGGLGSPVALYLGTAGVGRITLVDHDTVELTNLQRQIAHNLSRVGLPKAESARQSIAAINPDVQVRALARRADTALLDELVPQAQVVLDCSDNFATRHAVNAACVRHGVPLISGAAIGFDGQVSVYDTRRKLGSGAEPGVGRDVGRDVRPDVRPEVGPAGSSAGPEVGPEVGPGVDPEPGPCYACIFPPDAAFEEVACATMGVFAPLVGIIGSVQAAEALKLLARVGTSLSGRLLMLDARSMQWDELRLARQPSCAVCGPSATGPR